MCRLFCVFLFCLAIAQAQLVIRDVRRNTVPYSNARVVRFRNIGYGYGLGPVGSGTCEYDGNQFGCSYRVGRSSEITVFYDHGGVPNEVRDVQIFADRFMFLQLKINADQKNSNRRKHTHKAFDKVAFDTAVASVKPLAEVDTWLKAQTSSPRANQELINILAPIATNVPVRILYREPLKYICDHVEKPTADENSLRDQWEVTCSAVQAARDPELATSSADAEAKPLTLKVGAHVIQLSTADTVRTLREAVQTVTNAKEEPKLKAGATILDDSNNESTLAKLKIVSDSELHVSS